MSGNSVGETARTREAPRCSGTGVGALFVLVAVFLEAANPWAAPVFFALVACAFCFVPPAAALRLLGRGVTLGRLLEENLSELRGSDRRRLSGARSLASAPTAAGREQGAQRRLLEAIERRGELTAARAALETGLSVAEADEILFELANRGHLEVRVEGAKILYALP